MLNERTKQNLRRKSHYIDHVQVSNGLPLFSWIDINPTELCNRKCVFCPRVNESEYPNQHLFMSQTLAKKIADELRELQYQGVVVFSGYGEPMMCPHLPEIIRLFRGICRLEIVTNGDLLTDEQIAVYHDAGIDYFVVSLYDGPEQVEAFQARFARAGLDEKHYILRDRWHTEEDGFGIKLTNRAGTVHIGDQPDVNLNAPCYYTAYSMTIDWNGDVLLCMQDWHKKVKFGNVALESLESVWHSKHYNRFRRYLLTGSRCYHPCTECNTDGTLHGYNHKNLLLEKFK